MKARLAAPVWKRLRMLVLCLSVLLSVLPLSAQAVSSPRKLTLQQAQSMALSSNSKLTKLNNQIILKKMKYTEAVKGIQAKVKNLRSFRWSPLLSFQFPQPLDMPTEYDLNIKPITLQAEIDTMNHQMADIRYEILHDVNQKYFEVYFMQEKTAFVQLQLADAEQQLARNTGKLVSGGATQADVDRAQSAVDKLTSDLANLLRKMGQSQEKLSELIHVNVSVGYTLVNPYQVASISRDKLDDLISSTLSASQTYYEVKTAAATAKLNLDAYESLMRKQYGGKINRIQSYINMARKGLDVDYGAFQLSYNEMLKDLDRPWDGTIRIIFFRFTKEWFKGSISGTRYIEDEMYAVYTACMEYANAMKDLSSTEKEIRTNVKDTYEALITAYNAYLSLEKSAAKNKDGLDRLLALNKLGKAEYSEVADAQSDYETAQLDALESLKDYNVMISEFDRLTCGAAGKFLKGVGVSLEQGGSGDAFAILDPIADPYYYIYTSVADLTFYIGVSIPEGYSPEIDAFEVWMDGVRIGKRTSVGEELRHLALDYGGGEVRIRLFRGSTFVDECEIDAAVPRDRLSIKGGRTLPTTRTVGSYTVKTTENGSISTSQLTLKVNASEGAAGYTLAYDENRIYATDIKPLDESFT